MLLASPAISGWNQHGELQLDWSQLQQHSPVPVWVQRLGLVTEPCSSPMCPWFARLPCAREGLLWPNMIGASISNVTSLMASIADYPLL